VNDADAMRLALRLAAFGEGDVNPNPLVGAVVVREGRIVGRGYHRRFGGPHAEVFALDEAGDLARGATLYTTLEPCCHHGKTPPCTERIIAAGIARVVSALRDPSPPMAGNGIARLRDAGIDVAEGVLEADAARQNEVFLHWVTRNRPFVHLKLAASLDGRIATRTGDARWISGESSRIAGHRLRRRYASILVGVSTVVSDDPRLTVRHVVGRDPVSIVLDPSGRVPASARLLARNPIVVTSEVTEDLERALAERGARIWRVACRGDGRFDLTELLRRLREHRIDSVLIEGGGETAAMFLEQGLVDKLTLFIAPIVIGGRDAIPAFGGAGAKAIADAWRLRDVMIERLGDDLAYTGYPVRPNRGD